MLDFKGWWSKLITLSKRAFSGAKKLASNPMVRDLGQKAFERYMAPGQAEAEEDKIFS